VTPRAFGPDLLRLDAPRETERICRRLREAVGGPLRRRGLVIGLSGGIDSSVSATLAVRALGAARVFGLLMPERHSDDDTLRLSRGLAESLGIRWAHEDISPVLDALGCYRRYDEAVRGIVPEYGPGWKSKIVTSDATSGRGFRLFSLVAKAPDGREIRERLPLEAYLGVVASTSFKQRTRKMLEYYHADRLHYAVVGTPNRLEYDQGFFVKNGDGAADVKPIAHLYKTQVYELAEHLGVPEEIRSRPPSTDTYSLEQGQDEFYFSLPFREMDLCLWAKNHGVAPEAVASAVGLTAEQVGRVFDDIDTKRATTAYLHLPPLLLEDVPEVSPHPAKREAAGAGRSQHE
jgi:NAD+ synthase